MKLITLVILALLTFSAIPVVAATGEGTGPGVDLSKATNHQVETPASAPADASAQRATESDKTKRGMWVVQNTPIKKLKVDVHLFRSGKWSVVTMELIPGVPGFISCSGDYIWATAKGGWGNKDVDIRQNFKSKYSEREVYQSEITLVGSALQEARTSK